MTPAEALAEARRRIREVQASGQDWLDLGDLALAKLPEELGTLTTLRVLALGKMAYLPVKGWSFVINRSSPSFADVTPLAGLTVLQQLDLHGCEKLTDLTPLAGLADLQRLDLSHSGQLTDLTPLASLYALQRVNLAFCGQLSDLAPLAGLTALQSLHLLGCGKLTELAPLAGLTDLQQLDLTACGRLTELAPLAGLIALQSLSLSVCGWLSELAPIAGLTALERLALCSCKRLTELGPISGLTALQSLDLTACENLTELAPLAGLTALRSLNLTACMNLTKAGPIGGLSTLESLRMTHCRGLNDLTVATGLKALRVLDAYGTGGLLPKDLLDRLPELKDLKADRFPDAPPEVLSGDYSDDCLHRLRAWWDDLKAGETRDREVKLFVLGNGGTGKTQVCRRLRGLSFDPAIPTTHGVQLEGLERNVGTEWSTVRINLWDFGGQDLYHGTHALFLQGRAVFLVLWRPELEATGDYEENGVPLRHRPLAYWLDYVHSLAGKDATVVVAQAQCDDQRQRQPPPIPVGHALPLLEAATCSAKDPDGMEVLEAQLRRAVRTLLKAHGSYRLGRSWAAVRDAVRERLDKGQRTMTRAEFDAVCADIQNVSQPAMLLDYLHRSGVVFHHDRLFGDAIVLDQQWALEAIYAVFDRQRVCPILRRLGGRFTRADLDLLVWGPKFSPAEQEVFLRMMASCAICFPLRHDHDKETVYAAPDLLPDEAALAEELRWRWPAGPANAGVALHYGFLHEGILRRFLCAVGRVGGEAALYWRYGCWFHDAKTNSSVRVRQEAQPTPENPARGRIVIEARGPGAGALVKTVREAIERIRLGVAPEVMPLAGTPAPEATPDLERAREEKEAPLEVRVRITDPPALPGDQPEVFISYAWGDETPEGQQREEVVERLCAKLDAEGFAVRRDKTTLRPGDSIHAFANRIGRGKRVVVVLSGRYLKRPLCMEELLAVFHDCQGDREEFQRRVIALVLDDAPISEPLDRMRHAQHWGDAAAAHETVAKGMKLSALGQSTPAEQHLMEEFHAHTVDMLTWLKDTVMPRGFEAIAQDDHHAVLERLRRDL